MKIRLVIAHPGPDSLSHRFAAQLARDLSARRHVVEVLDLYAQGFDPVLTQAERADYYARPFADDTGLTTLDGLILVFPTWWFGLPAILKGWIDRTYLPGVAYRHDAAGGALQPNLTWLKSVLAVTTLGSPAWIDTFVTRKPVEKSLRWGVVKPCAPQARFKMLSLYGAETLTQSRLQGFETRLSRAAHHLFPTEP